MFIAYKYSVILKNAHYMIFLLLHCFPTLSSKCLKGRFVALRFICHWIKKCILCKLTQVYFE